MSQAPVDANLLQKRLRRKLAKLEKLSPTQIRQTIAGHRSGFSQSTELLSRWLCEQLDIERISIKTQQNLIENLEITVEVDGVGYVFKFLVKRSLQDFLEIKKHNDAVAGVSLSPEQVILVRSIIDREGGSETEFIKELLNSAFANSPVVAQFVQRVKDHPEWHRAMHEAGLYPADIFAAHKKICKAVKNH